MNDHGIDRRNLISTKDRPSIRDRFEALQTAAANKLFDWTITKANRALPIIVQERAGMNARPIGEHFPDYHSLYQRNVWTFASVVRKMAAAATLEWAVYKEGKDGSRDRDDDHPLADLLKKPHPRLTFGGIVMRTIAWLNLDGTAFWAMEAEGSSIPNEIWILNPAHVEIKPDPENEIGGYIFKKGAGSVSYDPEEVVHFAEFNPMDEFFGQGRITAARDAHIQDLAATLWNRKFFERGSRPGGLLIGKKELRKTQIDRLLDKWTESFQGVENAHGLNFIWGVDYQETGKTPKDVDFTTGRKFNREEILAAFNMPPALVGLLEYANYSNMKEQKEEFWTGMLPEFNMIRDPFNLQFVALHYPGYVIDYDRSKIPALQEDANQKVTRQRVELGMGKKNINDLRAEDGLDPVPHGEEYYLDLSLVPLSLRAEPSPASSSDGNGDEPEEEEERRIGGNGSPERKLRRKAAVLSAVRINDLLPDSDEESKLLEGMTRQLRAKAAKRGSEDVISVAGKSLSPMLAAEIAPIASHEKRSQEIVALVEYLKADVIEPTIDYDLLNDPNALRSLQALGANKALYITDSMRERIRRDLVVGLESGEGLNDLVDRVESATGALRRQRFWASRIARTEVRQDLNFGALYTIQEVGTRKVWIAAIGPATRELHSATDDVSHRHPVAANEIFEPIGAQAPGMTGRAEDDINCQCDVAPHVEGLTRAGLRFWTRAWQKQNDIRMEQLSGEWVPVLHRYLSEYTERVQEALRS